MNKKCLVVLACKAALKSAPICYAQCGTWQPVGDGSNGVVSAFATHNGELIAGGSFSSIGGKACNNIARWNGSSWQPLGSGTSGSVDCLTTYHGELIAGGSFTSAGEQVVYRIAAWNGAAWHPLGVGMNGYVYSLAVIGDELIAGGDFTLAGTTSGTVNVNHVARWNGTQWQPLGSGFEDFVESLTVHEGNLVATDLWTVKRWDGTSWQQLGQPFFLAYVLASYRGRLIASGHNDDPNPHIAAWNGSIWQPLDSGLQGSNVLPFALAIYNGDLIAGGVFESAGGLPASSIARWNGVSWQPLSAGFGGGPGHPVVAALTVFNDDLIAGGNFSTAGGKPASNTARWRDCNLCSSDLNLDHQVGIDDLVSVITAWGQCPQQPIWCGADIWPTVTGDGQVNIDDLVHVIQCFNFCTDIDTNGDGHDNIDDLVNVVTSWGPCPTQPPQPVCQADITRSGNVDIDDLVAVITTWGPCP